MASFDSKFIPNSDNGKSKPEAIKQGSFYRITILSERLIRIEYSKEGKFNDKLTDFVSNRNFSVPNFTCNEDDKFLEITTKYFQLQYEKDAPIKASNLQSNHSLKVKLLNTDKEWYYGHPETLNYGGSAFSLDDFNGKVKLGKGLYSTDGFVSISDTNTLTIQEDGSVEYNDNKNIDIYLFIYRRDFGLCLNDYFTLTGYPELIPRYALGIWWYRDKIYSFEDIKTLLKTFKENEIPLSVLMLGEFWHSKDKNDLNKYKTGYTFNKELFPSPKELTSYLHDRGIKLGIQIDDTEGIRPDEPVYKAFEHFAKDKEGNIPFNVLNKEYMALYFEKIINPLLENDIDFFWIDYMANSQTLRVINYYQHINQTKNAEKRPFMLTRNTGVGSHKFGALYSGETIVSWDTLKYLPFFNATSSNIGLSWWSHDVGGFKEGIEDEELYRRYVQFATFSPIFRFSAERGVYYKREPWRWDFKTYNIVKNYCTFRYKLIPYIYTEGYTYSKTGLPLIQPLYYVFPDSYYEPQYRNEYFFGSELFVCPITNPKDNVMNRTVHRILLPKGTWYDFKSGKKYIGGKRYITFFKDEDYPVFAKAGAIIPLSGSEKVSSIANPEKMNIHIFPGQSNTYNLYEDDGYTSLYKEGYYIVSQIDYNYMKNNYTVIIHPLEGKTLIIPEKRTYKILFRNTKEADKVEVFLNTEKLTSGVSFYVEGNNFVVEVANVDTMKQLTINCSGQNIEIDGSRIVNDDINSIINDLKINTKLKEDIARIAFSNLEIKKKRIAIRRLKSKGLDPIFIQMFIKLYDYLEETK